MTPPQKPTAEARVRQARKIAIDAIGHAAVLATNPALQRSTRTRAAYKVKADALDRVLCALNGKPVR